MRSTRCDRLATGPDQYSRSAGKPRVLLNGKKLDRNLFWLYIGLILTHSSKRMRMFSSVRKANSGLYMRKDESTAAWRSQNGSGKLPDRGVRSLADSTFNPRARLG